MANKVRVLNWALAELDDQLIVRGVIDPASLKDLKIAPYQREVLSEGKVTKLMDAHRNGGVDDIKLGMRGARTSETDDGQVLLLLDDTYIIDGQQRTVAGIRVMKDDPPVVPYIGATIRFNTDEATERRLFRIFNLDRTNVSGNVILRNEKEDNPALAALFRLTHDASFVLRGRVTWTQAPRKHELISATTFVKVIGRLHGRFGPGKGSEVLAVASGLDRIMGNIGRPTLVANTKAFFDLIEECWGLSIIEFVKGAVVIKSTFLMTLARVLVDHKDFWTEDRLTVPATLSAKLSKFKVNDPTIANLAGSSGAAGDVLYDLVVRQLNSGRRRPLETWGKSAVEVVS